MSDKPMCKHVYVAGPKKGTVCGKFCRSGREKCGEHNKNKCEHNRQKSACKECGGSSICEHDRVRTRCRECGGGSICEHNRQRSRCRECGGGSICEHNQVRSNCKECGGSSICEHNRRQSRCRECGGSSICEHDRIRISCKECGGSSICEHDRRQSRCKECGGGSICEHNRIRTSCRECGGGNLICEHDRQQSRCKECNPKGYLMGNMSSRTSQALKQYNCKSSLDYLNCDNEDFREYIEAQFKQGMNWENYGSVWHIDHKIPLMYKNIDGSSPSLEQVIERLDFENCQPMLAFENFSKGSRYISE